MTRFDSVVAYRVSGDRGERAALVLGFKELREVVLLTFLS